MFVQKLSLTYFDHKFVTVGFTLSKHTLKSCYFHFSTKPLDDKDFCEVCKLFWEKWQTEKGIFENIIQWWEVGKAHIRDFSQKCSSFTSIQLKVQ